MLITPYHNYESPPCINSKDTQYQSFIMYPLREKIEFPKYNESDDQCVAWLKYKVDEYFNIYNIVWDEEKVKYASMHLEGHSYNWYIWGKGDIFSYTWKLFKNDF